MAKSVGPYESWVEDINKKKMAQESQRVAERQPVTQRFTPLAPEGRFSPPPSVGPAATPAAGMASALASPRDTFTPPVAPATTTPTQPSPFAMSFEAPTLARPVTTPATPTAGGPTRAAAPAGTQPTMRPPVAELPARTVGLESQTMTSPAALALQQSLNRRLRSAEINTMTGDRHGRTDINSVAGQRLAAQWDDAARSAFMNAMTPEQRTRFERDEAQQAIQRARIYEMTPGAIESKRASETARDVAKAQGASERAKLESAEKVAGIRTVKDDMDLEYRKARSAIIAGAEDAETMREKLTALDEAYPDRSKDKTAPAGERAANVDNTAKIAKIQDLLAKYPNDPKAAVARAELARLMAGR